MEVVERIEALPRWPSGPAKIAAMRRQATPADEGVTLGDRRHQVGGECLTSPGLLGIDGQAGTDGLADWQTAGGQQRVQAHRMHRLGAMDVLSSTIGACRTAELPRRLVPLGAT